jgi:hypothetical protein
MDVPRSQSTGVRLRQAVLVARNLEPAYARGRAAAFGVRIVWSIDTDDISAGHLHPTDLGGTIVSIRRCAEFAPTHRRPGSFCGSW